MEQRLSSLLSGSAAMTELIKNLGGGDVGVNAGFLSAMFFFLPLFLMAFAVTQVNGWSSDEQDGRLDLVLAAPQARPSVLLGRFAALATATVVIAVVTLLVSAGAAAAAGLDLNSGNLAAATLGMIPLGLLIASIGYLASGWLRTAADTGLLSFVLAAWFMISFVGAWSPRRRRACVDSGRRAVHPQGHRRLGRVSRDHHSGGRVLDIDEL